MKTQRDSMILRCHLYTDIFCIYYFIAPHLLQKGSKYDRKTFQLLLLQLQSHQGWARIEATLSVCDFCREVIQANAILQTDKNRNIHSVDVTLKYDIFILSLIYFNTSTVHLQTKVTNENLSLYLVRKIFIGAETFALYNAAVSTVLILVSWSKRAPIRKKKKHQPTLLLIRTV